MQTIRKTTGNTAQIDSMAGFDGDIVIEAGAAGSLPAIKEVADRLDGKPHQSLGVSEVDETQRLAAEEHLWAVCYPPEREDDE